MDSIWQVKQQKGEIILPVNAAGTIRQTKFNIIDGVMRYNALLGRPWIHDMRVVPSTLHMIFEGGSWSGEPEKFETGREDIALEEDLYQLPRFFVVPDDLDATKSTIEELEQVVLHDLYSIGCYYSQIEFGPKLSTGEAKVEAYFRGQELVCEGRGNGSIREVEYPDWFANVVVVPKKGNKFRMCIDFKDLNKAYPKESFPLPYIDLMIDATIGDEMLSFLDAYSG
ncbi:uncharacterized protein LOC132031990 [Lycium ferocissimum]|uniref:uncharacterized protein LOC132031990 n=1 Tax=Lycium ferocissimum TaxID=112874 RepID=UPI0028165B51|nr:uncharacterized protein LOC132031990 [Lycium ferocissimum]